jgi:hypothetical protein
MTVPGPSAFSCGPLDIEVVGAPDALVAKITECLLLFDHAWPTPRRAVRIAAAAAEPAAMVDGTYLDCARMAVRHRTDGTIEATTRSGAWSRGAAPGDVDTWSITAPPESVDSGALEDVEDLVGLALTTGWRRAGWVPVHAAGVVHDEGVCALLCAPSGGGKSTLTAALVRRGWRVLGDDKLLLRTEPDGRTRVAALLHTFNLHPGTRQWFPEVGDLERLPAYSAWTPKRKVKVTSVWDGATASEATPTHVVTLRRVPGPAVVTAVAIPGSDVLSALLHQTVIPSDRATAAAITRTIAECGRSVQGVELRIGDDAYRDPDAMDAVEQVLLPGMERARPC